MEKRETAQQEKTTAPQGGPEQETLLRFIRTVPKTLRPEERTLFRLTGKGLFVDERAAARLVAAWQRWITEIGATSAGKAQEKHFRRIFGSEYPEEFYLLDGKVCQAGYLIPFAAGSLPPGSAGIDLPRYQGSLLEAKQFLHHKDPIFETLPGVQAELALEGLLIRVKKGSLTITFTQSLLIQFQALAAKNARFAKRFPQLTRSLRAGLPALSGCLRAARPVSAKDPLLIPTDLRLKDGVQYFRFGPLVFASVAGIVERCYPARGSGLMQFLEAEVAEIRKDTKRVGVFGLDSREPDFAAHLMLRDHHERVLIHAKVIRDLYRAADPEIFLPTKGAKCYTVFNCLLALSRLLERSEWISEQDVPQRIRDMEPKQASYRAAGNWIFLLKKNRAYACAQKQPGLKEPLPPPLPHQPQGPKHRTDRRAAGAPQPARDRRGPHQKKRRPPRRGPKKPKPG